MINSNLNSGCVGGSCSVAKTSKVSNQISDKVQEIFKNFKNFILDNPVAIGGALLITLVCMKVSFPMIIFLTIMAGLGCAYSYYKSRQQSAKNL